MKSGQCEMGSKLAPMGCAAAQGRTECLQALLDAGAPVDTEDGYGMTPLQVCHLFAEESIIHLFPWNSGSFFSSSKYMNQSPSHICCSILL